MGWHCPSAISQCDSCYYTACTLSVGFPQLCQWALMTFVRLHGSVLTNDNFTSNQGDQADVNFVDVSLSLIYRWMESYIATNRLNDNEISIIFAIKLLEGMLQMNHNSRLSNKQLINSFNILMVRRVFNNSVCSDCFWLN